MMKVPGEYTHVIDTDTVMQHFMRLHTWFFIGNLPSFYGNARIYTRHRYA